MTPLSPPDFDGVQPEHLLRAMQLCEQGKGDEILTLFESDFSKLVGSKYTVATSSATTGLHLALLALGIGEGDVVICPAFTFAASAFPIMYQKAIPVFVDSETETWNMSPTYLTETIERLKAKGKRPKAVMIVHSYGNPAKLDDLISICQKHAIPIIEDAANALGSTYSGKQVGGFGTIGIFSFNRNKIISAAGGGCLVTNAKSIAERARYFAHQAKSKTPYYQHENIGYNYGLSPILAEIVRVQLPTLAIRVNERQIITSLYKEVFKKGTFWQHEDRKGLSNHWLNVVGSNTHELLRDISELAENLNIEVKKTWKPMHLQPVFEQAMYVGNNESTLFFNKSLCLPFSNKLANAFAPASSTKDQARGIHTQLDKK